MAKKLLVTVVVLMAFQDKFDHKTQYPVGAELEVAKERADDLVNRGLAKMKEEAPPKAPTDKKTKVKKPAETPVSGEEAKVAEVPPVDNPEKKQEDESGSEE